VIRDVGVAKMGVFPTFPVSVRLTESAAGIRPGMSATVEAYLSDTEEMAEPVYLVPLKALMKDRDSVYLFLVRPLASREAGLVVRQNVQVGAVSGHLIEVVSGVKAEDRVITAGLHSVHDGLQVKMTPFNGGIQ
jgi:multidrug efflux pump subunit AcrA (membrane-fusion protein)